jgi:hypothetical protein
MDLISILIGFLILGVCTVPFVMMRKNQTNRHKRVIREVSEFAKTEGYNLTIHEVCADFILGADEQKKYLIFQKHELEPKVTQSLNLSDIKMCKVVNSYKNGAQGSNKKIDKIDLQFISNNNKPDTTWSIYKAEESLQLSGELQVAEKWAERINQIINTMAKP